ncbi:MAG: hypothetical protein H0W90_14720 [Actinobacteria bacterium]|nr:hypothetical protein [Actinomycetota bacterium]
MEEYELGPITGDYPDRRSGDVAPDDIPAHEGFDRAWEDAKEKAASDPEWKKAQPIWVTAEYVARIDITNPGSIGHYSVIITPHGGGT